MGLVKEFKEFIVKGNAIDMAVGIIVGAAFGAVIKSFVEDVLMPPLGYLMGGIDFSAYKFMLSAAGQKHPVTGAEMPAVSINYGMFLNALVTLMIQGFAIFMVVKMMNKMKRAEAAAPAPAAPPADIALLTEIRDLLKKR